MSDSDQKQKDFLAGIRQQLDTSVDNLDSDTLRELRLARSRAVAAIPRRLRFWQPVGAMALAATVAAVAIGLQFRTSQLAEHLQPMEDMQLLSASDELELYEDLEFYQWLELEGRTIKG